METKNKLLLNEPPLQLLPTLACYVGVHHALLLQQLYYLENNLQGEVDELGNKWVRVVIEGKEKITWCNIMPYIERNTIRQVLEDLESEGFIKSRNFTGRPLYYRVDKFAVDSLSEPVARICKAKKRGRVITPSIVCKSDDTSIVYKSDDNHLINRQSSSNNQTTIVYKLDTSENTIDSTKNHQDSTTIATKSVAQKVVEVVTSQDELITAYCNALEWDIRQKDNNRKATKAINELTALYPTITASEITSVINHANQVYKLKPTQLSQQWLKLSNEVALMNDRHLTEIAMAIKGIYSLNGNTPYGKLWEIYGVASQAKLYQLQASDFVNFTSKWPSHLNLPGLDKLLTNVAKIKGETNNVKEITGNDSGQRGAIDSSIFAGFERAKMAMPVL